MKILSLSLFFVLASFTYAKCQVNPIDTLGYRISVVCNVKDVALVTGMPQSEQLTLAAFFKKEEDAINTAVNSGVDSSALLQLQNQLVAEFQSILSAQELIAYRSQRKDSIFAKVLVSAN